MDVHYYENGNVRLLTSKPINTTLSSSASASEITRQVASIERKYHDELNRAFSSLSEGAFKSLRRQLPVTRQKVEWEKISTYRVSCTAIRLREYINVVTGGTRYWGWQKPIDSVKCMRSNEIRDASYFAQS